MAQSFRAQRQIAKEMADRIAILSPIRIATIRLLFRYNKRHCPVVQRVTTPINSTRLWFRHSWTAKDRLTLFRIIKSALAEEIGIIFRLIHYYLKVCTNNLNTPPCECDISVLTLICGSERRIAIFLEFNDRENIVERSNETSRSGFAILLFGIVKNDT